MDRSLIEVAGLRSPVVTAGPDAVPEAVVFVHGNPGSGEDWAGLIDEVGHFARAIAPDMPGYGGADKPDEFEYTVGGYSRHLESMLGHLGVERAHLVLHDFGGLWGLAWAAEHPERFASVVLINAGVLLGYRWHYLARIWRTPVLGEIFMATTTKFGFRMLLRQGNPRGLPVEFVDRMYRDFDRGTKRAVLKLYRDTDDVASQAQSLSEALRPLDRPALVIWGRHDPYIPVEQAEVQRSTFPNAEVVVFDDSGHWPFADHPGETRDRILPFLRSVTSSEGR